MPRARLGASASDRAPPHAPRCDRISRRLAVVLVSTARPLVPVETARPTGGLGPAVTRLSARNVLLLTAPVASPPRCPPVQPAPAPGRLVPDLARSSPASTNPISWRASQRPAAGIPAGSGPAVAGAPAEAASAALGSAARTPRRQRLWHRSRPRLRSLSLNARRLPLHQPHWRNEIALRVPIDPNPPEDRTGAFLAPPAAAPVSSPPTDNMIRIRRSSYCAGQPRFAGAERDEKASRELGRRRLEEGVDPPETLRPLLPPRMSHGPARQASPTCAQGTSHRARFAAGRCHVIISPSSKTNPFFLCASHISFVPDRHEARGAMQIFRAQSRFSLPRFHEMIRATTWWLLNHARPLPPRPDSAGRFSGMAALLELK